MRQQSIACFSPLALIGVALVLLISKVDAAPVAAGMTSTGAMPSAWLSAPAASAQHQETSAGSGLDLPSQYLPLLIKR